MTPASYPLQRPDTLYPGRAGVIAVLLLLFTPQPSAADAAAAEIEALIQTVETSGCTFIRNDTRHDAGDAAEHLRLKYRRGKRYADTTEHFIERLASKSSWSGKPYFIECDNVQEEAGDWLTDELHRLRAVD